MVNSNWMIPTKWHDVGENVKLSQIWTTISSVERSGKFHIVSFNILWVLLPLFFGVLFCGFFVRLVSFSFFAILSKFYLFHSTFEMAKVFYISILINSMPFIRFWRWSFSNNIKFFVNVLHFIRFVRFVLILIVHSKISFLNVYSLYSTAFA